MTNPPTASTTQAMETTLPLPKVLLMGDSGTGKTHAIRTLIDAGITPFVVFTEQGMETIFDLPKDKWHWRYIKPFQASFEQLVKMNSNILNMSYKALTELQDPMRSQCRSFLDYVANCNNFVCDCCKKSHGDIGKWKTDRFFCTDGLSGLSTAAMNQTTGVKVTRGQNEWGVAMNTVNFILEKLCSELTCGFLLLAHEEREKDEITGGTFITVKTLGQKLAPDIPRKFSDVIRAVRTGPQFTWDTIASNCVTKSRNLPLKGSQEPSFVPLIETWKRKGGRIIATPST